MEADFRPQRWRSFREELKFTGKEEDIQTGLTYFGARYYQAHLGRWASPDPVSVHGISGDLNPYAYVAGRVFRSTDPLGLQSDEQEPPPWAGSCGPDVTCLPPDTITVPPPAPAPAPPTGPPPPAPPPAPTSESKPEDSKGTDTSGLVSRLADRAAGAVAQIENTRFNIGTRHFVIGNVHRAAFDEAVSALGPVAWAVGADRLKVSIKSDEGDISEAMAATAAAIASAAGGGGGSGNVGKFFQGNAGGYAVSGLSRMSGTKLTVQILGLSKSGAGQLGGLRAVLNFLVREGRALGAREVEIIAPRMTEEMRPILEAAEKSGLLGKLGVSISWVSGDTAILTKAIPP